MLIPKLPLMLKENVKDEESHVMSDIRVFIVLSVIWV